MSATRLHRLSRPHAVRLACGTRLGIRPLGAADAAPYEAFLRGLSPQTVQNRLLGAGLTITPEQFRRLLEVDQLGHVALAGVIRAEGAERIVGVARYAVEADSRIAELAVTVADAWQGRGVGRALLAALIRRARRGHVATLFGDAFPANVAMLGLMRSQGFALATSPGDRHLTRGVRDVRLRGARRVAPPLLA